MKITKDNIGDVICKYQNGKRIFITEVDDTHVHYLNESLGCRCVTDQFTVMGTKDLSPEAKEDFLDNWNLARALDDAKVSALRQVFSGSLEDKEKADKNFKMVTDFQKDFYNNILNDTHDRKESLLEAFLAEIESIKPGEKMYFYKNRVEKSSIIDGYVVNGIEVDKNEVKYALLAGTKILSRKLSVDELINSAQKRCEYGAENIKPHNVNKETFEIGQ